MQRTASRTKIRVKIKHGSFHDSLFWNECYLSGDVCTYKLSICICIYIICKNIPFVTYIHMI